MGAEPSKPVSTVTIHFAGICEPLHIGGVCCYGYEILSPGMRPMYKSGFGERGTTKTAEYIALIKAVRQAIGMGLTDRKLEVFSHDDTVINQLTGLWGVNKESLVPLVAEVTRLSDEFRDCNFRLCDKEDNKRAMHLAWMAYKNTESFSDDARVQKARDIVNAGLVQPIGDRKYWVKNKYEVDLDLKTCSCPDNSQKHSYCKHLIACEIHEIYLGQAPTPWADESHGPVPPGR